MYTIDWQTKAACFGKQSKEELILWAYNESGTYADALELLNTRGKKISVKPIRDVMGAYRLKHGITKKRNPDSEYSQKYKSRLSLTREFKKQNGVEQWNYFCGYCGKRNPWPRKYTCCDAHMERLILRRGPELDCGVAYSSHGHHGRHRAA